MMWLWQKRAIEIMVNLIVAVRPIWRTRSVASSLASHRRPEGVVLLMTVRKTLAPRPASLTRRWWCRPAPSDEPERPPQNDRSRQDAARIRSALRERTIQPGGEGRPFCAVVLRAFSSEVDTGSREENASKQESRASVLIQSEPIML